tara:strand:+ start:583 stop:708 length:126 start_codon:yes stop_codon:yes gene_type:complete
MFNFKEILACPCCYGDFEENFKCGKCGVKYEAKEGIPVLIK